MPDLPSRSSTSPISGVGALARRHRSEITGVIHLAAQAGVRHSLTAPFDYVHSNLEGHMVILEVCRHELPNLEHLVYASSSSVYGGNTKIPFAVADRVDQPISLYAATKRANELMSHCYAHLYRMPQTGLRFFTVYGPWGRPDMAAYLFADAIRARRPITLNNHGDMERDFTYIDDIVAGVLAALDRPPQAQSGAPHALYNLGNHRPVPLRRFLGSSRRRWGKRPRCSWGRCRRATWCAPAPTSRRAHAISASSPRPRSRKACPVSSPGTASTTACEAPRTLPPVLAAISERVQPQVPCHGIEIAVAVQQNAIIDDAVGADQQIDGLADGHAAPT